MLSKAMASNRWLNTIERLQAQDRDHNDPFQLFSDSYSHYQGVTGVISGGHSTQNRQKPYFFAMLSKAITSNRCFDFIERL